MNRNKSFLNRLNDLIEANLENERFGVEDVAEEMNMDRTQVYRKLKALTGKSISKFIRETRLQKAMELLKMNVGNVSEIAYRVGFGSATYFNKCFHEYFGFPPGEVKTRTCEKKSVSPKKYSGSKLVAIMFTDIAGYTALMGTNEIQAFQVLRKNREIHIKFSEKYKGDLIKEIGDGMLICFHLASDAVRCAIEIQKACKEQNIPLRIGIHEGEIIYENNDVFGDGVNIASRILELAPVEGIYTSDSVFRNIKNKSGIIADYVDDVTLRNINEPIRIYQIKNIGFGIPSYRSRKGIISSKIKIIGIIAFSLLVLLSISYLFFKPVKKAVRARLNKTEVKDKSIAVLPFIDLSPEKDQEYFTDGMMEEILNHLYKISDLRVPSRTSLMLYKGSGKGVKDIARELNVSYILEGSVRKYKDEVRITVQLIDPFADTHLWSENYNKKLEDIFSIQSDVAQQIASYLNAEISPEMKERIETMPTSNLDAYDLYLKALNIEKKDQSDLDKVITLLQQSIRLDPGFAEAYLEMAKNLHQKGFFGSEEKIWKDSVLMMINKAIQLKPYLSEAYSTKAMLFYEVFFNYHAAEENYQLALKYDPNNVAALINLAEREYLKGNLNKAADYAVKYYHIKLANPMEKGYLNEKANFYVDYYDTLRAKDHLSRILETEPDHRRTKYWLCMICLLQDNQEQALSYAKDLFKNRPSLLLDFYGMTGDFQKVKKIVEEQIVKNPDYGKDYLGQTVLHRYGFALMKLGEIHKGEQILKQELQRLINAIESGSELNIVGGKYYDIACIYAIQGKTEDAIKYLTIAKENQLNGSFFFMPYLVAEPMFENIRKDPRFRKLINDQFQKELNYKRIFQYKVDSLQVFMNMVWLKDPLTKYLLLSD